MTQSGHSTELGDRITNAQAMPRTWYPNVLQSRIAELLKQVHVNVVCFEDLGVLREADPLQPLVDLAHADTWSSSTLASLRSGVSKPSVNQL